MPDPDRIVIIDGNPLLSEAFAAQLADMGYDIVKVGSLDGALAVDPPSALLLVAGPTKDRGIAELVRGWRAAGRDEPVLALSGNEAERREAAEAGADSCLEKPCRLSDLATGIADLVRKGTEPELDLGRFRFHPPSRVIIEHSGRQIRLTEKEAEILAYLYRAGGRPVARGELLNAVWGYSEGITTHTLETYIYRLRSKLEDGSGESRLLISAGGGYQLVVPDPPSISS